MLLNIYLIFNGNCREAFEFYRSVFGGDFAALQTFADAPADMQVPEPDRGRRGKQCHQRSVEHSAEERLLDECGEHRNPNEDLTEGLRW